MVGLLVVSLLELFVVYVVYCVLVVCWLVS